MAKKYYWLKLKEDFFDDDAIEWLEEQPKGIRTFLSETLLEIPQNGWGSDQDCGNDAGSI